MTPKEREFCEKVVVVIVMVLGLLAIRAVVAGDVPAPMCGRCDYCASRSRVQIADYSPSENPVIDDVFGINV